MRSAWVLCTEFHCRPVQEWTAEECGLLQSIDTTGVDPNQGLMLIYDIVCQYIIHLLERIGHKLLIGFQIDRAIGLFHVHAYKEQCFFFPICHIFHSRCWGHSWWNPGIAVVQLEWNITYHMHSHPGPLCRGSGWSCLWFKSQKDAQDDQILMPPSWRGIGNSLLGDVHYRITYCELRTMRSPVTKFIQRCHLQTTPATLYTWRPE